jgi:hypothetical protein
VKKMLLVCAVGVAGLAIASTMGSRPVLAAMQYPTEHWVAPGVWQMGDVGRNHGVITGQGIPKCNPWVSPECARLHPSLFRKVPRPR